MLGGGGEGITEKIGINKLGLMNFILNKSSCDESVKILSFVCLGWKSYNWR